MALSYSLVRLAAILNSSNRYYYKPIRAAGGSPGAGSKTVCDIIPIISQGTRRPPGGEAWGAGWVLPPSVPLAVSAATIGSAVAARTREVAGKRFGGAYASMPVARPLPPPSPLCYMLMLKLKSITFD